MRTTTLLAAALVSPLLIVAVPSPASAATCISRYDPNELGPVEIGDTRLHVEQDIFDDYGGALVNAWTANGWDWRSKTYASCEGDGSHVAWIIYRRDADTANPMRVYDKNWVDPSDKASVSLGD